MSEAEASAGAASAEQGAVEHPLLARLRQHLAAGVISVHSFRGDATAIVERGSLLEACRFLRDDPENAFDLLVDVTAVDYLGRSPRFEVVYHLYSIEKNHRIRVKVPLEESDVKIPSVVSIWPGANWLERETYDLYGVSFEGHPDLRRIYLYEEFQGHPLRKDYPKQKRQPLIGPGAIPRERPSGGE